MRQADQAVSVRQRDDRQQSDRQRALAAVILGRLSDVSPTQDTWSRLFEDARREGVAPLIYRQLRHAGGSYEAPETITAQFGHEYYSTLTANLIRSGFLVKLSCVLANRGVEHIILKGAALIPLVYSDPGLRPMADLDLFVRVADRERAKSILNKVGYECMLLERVPGFNQRFGCEDAFKHPRCSFGLVEIHSRLVEPVFVSPRMPDESLWARTVFVELDGVEVRVLGAEDSVLALASHAIFKHRARGKLIWFYDIDRLVRSFEARLSWPLLLELGEQLRCLLALRLALSRCVALFETPVPQDVLARLDDHRSTVFERAALHWNKTSDVLLSAWALPGWRNKIGYFRGHAMPSPLYIASCYGLPGRWPSLFYYGYRLGALGAALPRQICENLGGGKRQRQ